MKVDEQTIDDLTPAQVTAALAIREGVKPNGSAAQALRRRGLAAVEVERGNRLVWTLTGAGSWLLRDARR